MEGTQDNIQHAEHPLANLIEKVQESIQQVIVGQHGMIEQLLAGLLADGHILIEGVPGVQKHLRQNCWLNLLTRGSRGCSSHPTLCRAMCWAPVCSTRKHPRSSLRRGRFQQHYPYRRDKPRAGKDAGGAF